MSKTTAGYLTEGGLDPMKPTPLVLAAMVALRVDNMGDTCPAWIASAERRCGKPATDGHLCARHHQVAVRRWDARTAAEATRAERYATDRAILAPTKRARLADVEAEIARREPSAPLDRAAYTGNVHPSIARRRRSHLTDTNVTRMAALHREADQLRAWLKGAIAEAIEVER